LATKPERTLQTQPKCRKSSSCSIQFSENRGA